MRLLARRELMMMMIQHQGPHQGLADIASSRERLEITATVHKLNRTQIKNLQELTNDQMKQTETTKCYSCLAVY